MSGTIDSNTSIYLTANERDRRWGLECTTAGHTVVPPQSCYPITSHPSDHLFSDNKGRVLKEFALVYITAGSGTFRSSSVKKTEVESGTVITVFPGEWHTYSPSQEEGWTEWWVGFKGRTIDEITAEGFLDRSKPLLRIGYSHYVETLFQEIVQQARDGGSQFMLSGLVMHLLGYLQNTPSIDDQQQSRTFQVVAQAKRLMKDNVTEDLSPETIAEELNVSYSWLRHRFKEVEGVSMSTHYQQLKVSLAKEWLSTSGKTVSEIAFGLGFGTHSSFSQSFRKFEGVTPKEYRNMFHSEK